MTRLAGIFASLEGSWDLRKTITHAATALEPQKHWLFEGAALYTRVAPDTLSYHEEGSLSPKDGQPLQSWQDYIFICADDALQVFFARDGEKQGPFLAFHEKDCRDDGVLSVAAAHFCAPDSYKAVLGWLGPHRHQMEYIVAGPRKNYTSSSLYTRR